MMAQVCGLKPGEFVWTGGDCHLLPQPHRAGETPDYQSFLLLQTDPQSDIKDIDQFSYEDIMIENYTHHEHICANKCVIK